MEDGDLRTYVNMPLNDFYGIAANRITIYSVAFILMGGAVFACLGLYDHINQLISIPLKFMGMNAWHTAANIVLCSILVDVLFAHVVNLESISRLKRQGQRVKVSMAYGDVELPVSRYRLPQLMPVFETFLGAGR